MGKVITSLLVATGICFGTSAFGGVFDLTSFVQPGMFSIGVEPGVVLRENASGAEVNVKYTHGLSDLVNIGTGVGTGGGSKQFRAGLYSVFDLFPDYDSQPGVGMALQTYYFSMNPRLSSGVTSRWEITAVPYLHKAFNKKGDIIDPYVAVPFGLGLDDQGNDDGMVTVSIGSGFSHGEHLRFFAELGIAIVNTYTYFSGGMSYFY